MLAAGKSAVSTPDGQSATVPHGIWRRSDQLEIAPAARDIAYGRRHARNLLREWGLGHMTGDAEIVVSELLTNSVKESGKLGTPIRLRLLADDGQLIIEAWDRHPGLPRLHTAADLDESGRGLTVVNSIAERWGTFRSGGWKIVWAELLTTAPPITERPNGGPSADGSGCHAR
jgi:anti-sigma regulatory factor (Ser/Thr protein kinase)